MSQFNIIQSVFWFGIGFLLYTYIGYWLVLYILSIFKTKVIRKKNISPKVSVIIAAYNEEKAIGKKITNIISLDYPKELMEIIIGSDASSDNTDAIAKGYPDSRVRLIRVEGRLGKTMVQNKCAEEASGEILVFTDATTMLKHDSLARIMENFSDSDVGCVGAKLVYTNKTNTHLGEGGVSYWNYETRLKQMESKVSSLIGVSGCYYAVRKSIYVPIHPDLISDFVIALLTFKNGYRVVYEDSAICEEETLENALDEYNMRVRVAIRSYNALWENRELLNPFRYGLFSVQLISHKVMRYLIGAIAVIVFTSNLFLLNEALYIVSLAGQSVIYLMELISFTYYWKGGKSKVLSMPFYFVLANVAATHALIKYMNGENIKVWTPLR